MSEPSNIKNYVAERRLFAARSLVASIGMLALAGILALRLTWLQVFQHDYYSTRSDENRMRVEVAQPVRGLIYDRNGVLLADNLPSYRIEVVPEQVDDMDDLLTRLGKLIELRDVDIERFRNRAKREPGFRSIPLRSLLSPEEVARFEVNRQNFSGVNIVADLTRNYPLGKTAAHLIGYVGSLTEEELGRLDEARYRGASYVGKTGIERSYEDALHGQPGYSVTEANAAGRLLRQLDYKSPLDGRNLRLSIDAKVQIAAEKAMGDESGAVIALDPKTGGILALVSEPSFDPSLFIDGIDRASYKALNDDPQRPLFNRVLQGAYPPGSTIKPFMALAGLNYHDIGPHDFKYCKGYYAIPGSAHIFRDWKHGGHGAVDLTLAIIQSCDVYFYQLGAALGIDNIHDFLSRFGLGATSGIDLPTEKPGLVPSTEWKRRTYNQKWYAGETLSVAIGQGYLNTTPLQMAQAVGLIAVRGHGWQPHVLQSIQDPISNKIKNFKPKQLADIKLDPSYWQDVVEGMTGVIAASNGTAHRIAKDAQYSMAGKTGTAQVRGMGGTVIKTENQRKQDRDHAWFIAFAPVEDPKIAICVLVEHGGHGGAIAAPVARAVMDAYLLGQQPTAAVKDDAAQDDDHAQPD